MSLEPLTPKQVEQSPKAENKENPKKFSKLQTDLSANLQGSNPVRFFEFNKSDTDLESALINILLNMKGDADEKDQSSDISMDAVKQIMSNTGYPAFNYDVFKRIYDQDGDLKNVVADFDNEKIVIKTDQEAEDNPEMDFDNQGSTDVVKKMAKSAMNRRK